MLFTLLVFLIFILAWSQLPDIRFAFRTDRNVIGYTRILKVFSLINLGSSFLPTLAYGNDLNITWLITALTAFFMCQLGLDWLIGIDRKKRKSLQTIKSKPSRLELVNQIAFSVILSFFVFLGLAPTSWFFRYESVRPETAVKGEILEMRSTAWARLPGTVTTHDTIYCGMVEKESELSRLPVEMDTRYNKLKGLTSSPWQFEDTRTKTPFRPNGLVFYCETRSTGSYWLLGFFPKGWEVRSGVFPVD